MRAPTLVLGLSLLAQAAACCSVTPSPEDWRNVGFRTPAQCLRTFQTALAAGELHLEYRCISAGFKRRERLSELAWREARDRLEEELPFFRCLAKAEIVEELPLAPDRHRILAEVSVLFVTRRFTVDFVREDFFELWSGGRLLLDDEAPWEQHVRADPRNPEEIQARVPTYGELEPGDVTELRVGREWKIDGFAPVEPDAAP